MNIIHKLYLIIAFIILLATIFTKAQIGTAFISVAILLFYFVIIKKENKNK